MSSREKRLEILKKHFPNAVEEDPETGKIIVNEAVMQNLIDPSYERPNTDENSYELQWVGKRTSYENAELPHYKLLQPLKDESKDFETTKNILIKGDNLDALKILEDAYFEKVNMICIDPPYNTTTDEFVYSDDYTEDLDLLLERIGYAEERKDIIKDIYGSKTHSGWLSFMLPRLLLARELLTEDGVICINIDDNEQANLKLLCDEVFGAKNIINIFTWVNNSSGRQISDCGASKTYENILVYGKKTGMVKSWWLKKEMTKKYRDSYKLKDYDVLDDEVGEFMIQYELHNGNAAFNQNTRAKLTFNIHYNPNTKDIKFTDFTSSEKFKGYVKIEAPDNRFGTRQAWRWSKRKILEDKQDLYFIDSGDGIKIFPKIRDHSVTKFKNLITNTGKGSNEIKKLGIHFSHPKPTELIKILITAYESSREDNQDIIICDFFAGSGTTAHAVMDMNFINNSGRKYILVQSPEEIKTDTPKQKKQNKDLINFLDSIEKDHNIFEICAERIRRVSEDISGKNSSIDVGFKVFEIIDDPNKESDEQRFSEAKQEDLKLPVEIEKMNLLYKFMLAEKITLDNEAEPILEGCLYIVDNTAYIMDDSCSKEEIVAALKEHEHIEYISINGMGIAKSEFNFQIINSLTTELNISEDNIHVRN